VRFFGYRRGWKAGQMIYEIEEAGMQLRMYGQGLTVRLLLAGVSINMMGFRRSTNGPESTTTVI
jgi:hypothetical protein